MDDSPETLTSAQVKSISKDGNVPKGAVLLLVDDRIYQADHGDWRLLDNRCYSSVKEMTDAARSD